MIGDCIMVGLLFFQIFLNIGYDFWELLSFQPMAAIFVLVLPFNEVLSFALQCFGVDDGFNAGIKLFLRHLIYNIN